MNEKRPNTVRRFEDWLIDWLPHGSGIDGIWLHEFTRGGILVLKNNWHYMNEVGMYDGWYAFSVRVDLHLKDFRIVVHGLRTARDRNRMEGVKEYLYDLFNPVLEEAGLI